MPTAFSLEAFVETIGGNCSVPQLSEVRISIRGNKRTTKKCKRKRRGMGCPSGTYKSSNIIPRDQKATCMFKVVLVHRK